MAAPWAKGASSSSSSMPQQWKYDVFLSFRGVDTRNNFTSHLFAALQQHRFETFKDDKKLEKGEDVPIELLKAIEDSRISVIVFSKNYAESSWCLNELVQIMKCKKKLQQIVLPIFYDVYPSEVRAQKGNFEKAFAEHEKRFKEGSNGKVEKWRVALTDAANLSGWDLQNEANKDEAKVIEEIIEKIIYFIDCGALHVVKYPVGLWIRVEMLRMLLRMESNDVRIVAVWGVGGIGKTTIAKQLFNLIHHKFESSCFLANVRENSKQPNGLVVLQEELLSTIVGNKTHFISNIHQGIKVLKQRAFYCRKVLLVLDDVDGVQQLKDLAIDRNFFHPGSKIIITTRDKSFLNFLKVDENEIYEPKKLNMNESFELLSWHAFENDHAKEDFVELSKQVVCYTGGLPLALEVLGSYLKGKNISTWEDEIERLRKIPHHNILGILKISYDSLCEEDKNLFLDIACFFIGMDRDFTIKILESYVVKPAIGMQLLLDRCLMKYKGNNNQIVMHDMLRDMGREIVKQESKEPGRRSRLWCHEDALEVLRDGTGTELVEGLFLNLPKPNDVLNAKAFEKMNRLRLLHLNSIHLSAGYEHVSKKLVWLCWNGFPLACMPLKLSMENLVALDLRYSSLKQVWKGTMVLDKLKFLYLSHCYYLTSTPDFSGLRSLEKLLLNDCIRLVDVDESIKYLNKLVVLDLKNCKRLGKFPLGICMLKSLEYLDLSGCSNPGNLVGFRGSPSKPWFSFPSSWMMRRKSVDSIGLSLPSVQGLSCLTRLYMSQCNLSCLPSEIGSLISLRELDLSGNKLHTLPDGFFDLTSLENLYISGCELSHLPNEIGRLISLRVLNLGGNNLSTLSDGFFDLPSLECLDIDNCKLSHLSNSIGQLTSLRKLYLGGNNFRSLPESISDLIYLEYLSLNKCAMLQSLQELPQGLVELNVSGCASLENVSFASKWLRYLGASMDMRDCHKLVEKNFANNFMKGLFQYKGWRSRYKDGVNIRIYLPAGIEVPNWMQYQSSSAAAISSDLSLSLSFVVPPPPLVNRRTTGFLLCAVFSFPNNKFDFCFLSYNFRTKSNCFRSGSRYPIVKAGDEDLMWVFYFKCELEGGDELDIGLGSSRDGSLMVKWGLNFIYDDDDDDDVDEFPNEDVDEEDYYDVDGEFPNDDVDDEDYVPKNKKRRINCIAETN